MCLCVCVCVCDHKSEVSVALSSLKSSGTSIRAEPLQIQCRAHGLWLAVAMLQGYTATSSRASLQGTSGTALSVGFARGVFKAQGIFQWVLSTSSMSPCMGSSSLSPCCEGFLDPLISLTSHSVSCLFSHKQIFILFFLFMQSHGGWLVWKYPLQTEMKECWIVLIIL